MSGRQGEDEMGMSDGLLARVNEPNENLRSSSGLTSLTPSSSALFSRLSSMVLSLQSQRMSAPSPSVRRAVPRL